MITIPPTKPNEWHKRRDWNDYASKLFRYYSRRRDYALRLEVDSGPIAAVNPTTKIVFLNANFIQPTDKRMVRCKPIGMKNRITTNLKGYLAHEAAHVRFSSTKPEGILGVIWNSIEDERIERLMTAQHPHLQDVFTYLGDTHLSNSWHELEFTPLEGVLIWRWAHDHPTYKWTCVQPDVWTNVQPLVEAAWEEQNPDEVATIAQRILETLNLPEHTNIPKIMLSPLLSSPDQPNETTTTHSLSSPDQPNETTTHSLSSSDQPNETTAGNEEHNPGEDNTPAAGANPEPTAPEVLPESPDQVQARDLLKEVEGHARDLATALAITEKPSMPTNHQSRGKFDYGRYATGAQRTYRLRTNPARKSMPRITLLHDISGSMGHPSVLTHSQHHAVKATMMLQRACELSRTPLDIIVFDNFHEHLVTNTDDPETARSKIATIQSRGGTSLYPALTKALATQHDSNKENLIIIYCDGEITPHDAHACQQLVNNHPNVSFLPVLIGSNVNPTTFNLAFGRSIHVPTAEALPSTLKTWINANLN